MEVIIFIMYWKIKKDPQAKVKAQLREKTAEKRLLQREQNLIAVTNNFKKSLNDYRTKQILVIELLCICGELPRFKIVDFLIQLGVEKINTFLQTMKRQGVICCYRKDKQYYYSISERFKNTAYLFKFFIGLSLEKIQQHTNLGRPQGIINAVRICQYLGKNPFRNKIQIANELFITKKALDRILLKLYNECILTRSKMRLHHRSYFYYSLSLQDLEFKKQYCLKKINDFLNV